MVNWVKFLRYAMLSVVTLLSGFLILSRLPRIQDPTELTRTIVVRDDMNVAVDVAICMDSNCRQLAPTNLRQHLVPGQEAPANVSISGAPTTYRVVGGGHVRCITLQIHGEPPEHMVVPLSSARLCD
jgi:hypothetical protein